MSARRHTMMSAFEAVVVIGSQGALGPLLETLECLPSGFPVAMIVDLHRNGRHAGAEGLIERRAGMRARVAHDGATPGAGTVHLAPHDRQLTLTGERLLRVAEAADDRPWPRRADLLMRSA